MIPVGTTGGIADVIITDAAEPGAKHLTPPAQVETYRR